MSLSKNLKNYFEFKKQFFNQKNDCFYRIKNMADRTTGSSNENQHLSCLFYGIQFNKFCL
jgi:hypothetical protein